MFTIKDGTDGTLTLAIGDADGAQTTTVTTNGALTITNLEDETTIPIDIIVTYSGHPVANIIAAAGDNGILDIISAEFASSSLDIALNDEGDTIALSNGINASNGTGSISTIIDLPAGYVITATDGSAYVIDDPDNELIAEVMDAPLAELVIAERGDDNNVVDDNQLSYPVTLSLAEPSALAVALDSAITVTPTDASSVTVDVVLNTDSPTGTITITGLTNACSALPCDDAGTTTIADLTITETSPEEDSLFTINGGTDGSLTLAITDADGAQTTNVTTNGAIIITNLDDNTITLDITVRYSGKPAAELVTAAGDNGIVDLIPADTVSVVFAGQGDNAVAAWDTTGASPTLTITGLFNPTGNTTTGMVNLILASSLQLPAGYTISPSSPSFTDPNGTNQETITDTFSIAEGDGKTNEVSYNLNISLTALSSLEAALIEAITVTPTDDLAPIPTVAVSIDSNSNPDSPTGTITIASFSNACSSLPCSNADTTITFAHLTFVETNDEGISFFTGAPDTATAIGDADGARTTNNTISTITITNLDDDSSVELDIIVEYSGQPVANIITAANANDITELISAEFASSPLTIALNDTTIALSDGTNASNGTGSIIAAINLPAGYFITAADGSAYVIDDPDNELIAAVTDFSLPSLVLAERDTDNDVVDNNQASYNVTLSLVDAPALVIALQGAITVTPTDDPAPTLSVNVVLAASTGTITIAGFTNACSALPCDDAGTTTIANLTITQDDPAFSIDGITGAFITNITDAAGAQTTNVPTNAALTVTNLDDNSIVTLNIIVEYSGQPVANIVTAAGDTITDLISASFANKDLTLALNDTSDTFALSGGTNIIDGSGSIIAAANLPDGYAVTLADGGTYVIDDPDGVGTNQTNVTLPNLVVIAERGDDNNVVNENQISYAVTLELTPIHQFSRKLFFYCQWQRPAGY